MSTEPQILSGPAENARLDYQDAEIRLRVTSEVERRHRTRACAKEPWTVSWLQRCVQPGDVLYDLGANVGTFTLIAAMGRGARVVAVEPGYATYARLCENIQINGCAGSVIPVPLALAENNGMVPFRYRTLDPGQSRHRMRRGRWHFGHEGKGRQYEQPICAMRLDAARALFRWPAPTHLKLDVDGAEVRVLRGAGTTLALPGLRTVLLEMEAGLEDEVTSLMAAGGLSLRDAVRRPDAPVYAVFERG